MGLFTAVGFKSSFSTQDEDFIVASGGEIIDSGDFRIHKFTATSTTSSNYTFSVYGTGSDEFSYVDVLAIGGGGGGDYKGAGGAGGVVYFTASDSQSLDIGYYNVQVGGGGQGLTANGVDPLYDGTPATNGDDTYISASATSTFKILALGGGAGSHTINVNFDGGSGGGGDFPQNVGGYASQSLEPGLSGTYGYGNNGGGGGTGVIGNGAGGGGGAAQTGSDAYSTIGADGGDGIEVLLSGSAYYVGGGGGGSATDSSGNRPTTPGSPGLGGGGRGSWIDSQQKNAASKGTDGLGGGGGQPYYADNRLANDPSTNYEYGIVDGGSGAAMIRYKRRFVDFPEADSVTTDGDYKYFKFTTTGTQNISFSGSEAVPFDILFVGGGGGGGKGDTSVGTFSAGGGGAGGVVTYSNHFLSPGSYSITVGEGGDKAFSSNLGSSGDDTVGFGLDTAFGGGRGSSLTNSDAFDGGSGGGAFTDGVDASSPGSALNTLGEDGGTAFSGIGGGGGGASEPGNTDGTGHGGDGYTWVDGITYAGGGAGGQQSGANPGGTGGGGTGGTSTTLSTDGTDGLGGGGGGGAQSQTINPQGGDGGNGVIILKYKFK